MQIIKLKFPFITDKQEIIKTFRELQSSNFRFNEDFLIYHEDDGSVSYKGDVDFHSRGLAQLPFKFKKVSGCFEISGNMISTLIGCPEEIGKDFYCNNNRLTTLDGGPKVVGGEYDCRFNYNLQTFFGFPQTYRNFIFSPESLHDGQISWLNQRAEFFAERHNQSLEYRPKQMVLVEL